MTPVNARWRPLLTLLSAGLFATSATPLRAADPASAPATAPSPSPVSSPAPAAATQGAQSSAAAATTSAAAMSGSMAASSAASATPAQHLPGNDAALFASSIPTNSGPAISGAAPDSPSTSFAVNLLKRLVKRGILTQDDADELSKDAANDTAQARAQGQVDAATASQSVVTQVTQKVAEMVPQPPTDDTVSVPYVPDIVKQQIADEVKANVMKEAIAENWAAPHAVPDWVPRFRFTGDIRTRYEGDFFPDSNDDTGAFPNFNSINTGAPFDITGSEFSPQNNVDQDRQRFRIRARIGADVDLGDNFTAGIRLATGQDDSPVTENQTLGLANGGQGGDFSKYSVWLDRAFLKYQIEQDSDANKQFSLTLGRMDNPFFNTTLLWARDLGFDGIVAQGRYSVGHGLTPFATAGAFPIFNTDFNFATNQPAKYESEDKYLFAVQLGTDWTINKDWNAKVAGGLYYFDNIQGHLSDPFTPLSTADQGNTDDSRPAFAQNGNTYFPIRDIVPTAANDFGTIDQYQYYGLATPFDELDFIGQLNFDHFAPYRISLIGEIENNLAFNASKINQVAVNNRGANTASGAPGSFDGGGTAWIVTLKAGKAALEKRWDWDVDVGYRYLETDSVVDGFNDSDFGSPLTGTNLQGYTIGGDLALGERVWLGLHFMAADSIAGPPFKSDVVQFDINGKF